MASSTINRERLLASFASSGSTESFITSLIHSHHLQPNSRLFNRNRHPPTRKPSMSTPSSICVGIELEFLVALQPKSSPATGDTRWACPMSAKALQGLVTGDFGAVGPSCIVKVCESIASKGVPVACNLMPPEKSSPHHVPGTKIVPLTKGTELIRVWNQEAAASVSGACLRSNYWFIVPERHITLDCVSKSGKTPSDKYNWFGTELNSPILSRPEEFSQRLPTLRKCLAAVQDKMVVGLNSGCGLHLHVNDAGNMELGTALRVASLVWLLEDALLYPLCHPFRSTSPYSARISIESCIAMRKEEPHVRGQGAALIKALSDVMGQLNGRNKINKGFIGTMKRLWSEGTLDSLGQALRKYDEGPVHTTQRCALVVSKYNTIEFRYPESMYDVDYISCWADLARHLYAVALKPQAEFTQVFCSVYEHVTRDQMPGWPVMMDAIGFKTDLKRWQPRLDAYGGVLSNLDKQGILPKLSM
ncbi:hypothetical protein FZEAL_8688 [Fusarium zealandicum]|uniref:Amidoligase enzyme n=1 Tax=Fusarium zealandicum TaxID=1053134 RepID=A0A8H4UE02_9HYPO|nr:hypothetical protein FZEAL_8688 [Fusarium zealandicum]